VLLALAIAVLLVPPLWKRYRRKRMKLAAQ